LQPHQERDGEERPFDAVVPGSPSAAEMIEPRWSVRLGATKGADVRFAA
jgi:hypothetical protein